MAGLVGLALEDRFNVDERPSATECRVTGPQVRQRQALRAPGALDPDPRRGHGARPPTILQRQQSRHENRPLGLRGPVNQGRSRAGAGQSLAVEGTSSVPATGRHPPACHGEMIGMAEADDVGALERSLSNVAVQLFAAGTVQETLQQIVNLAERAVDGCDAAGVIVIREGQASTAAASAAIVWELDALQIEASEGPALDASTQGTTFYAQDLVDDRRWPTFAPRAVSAGIRSVIAFPLSPGRLSALNLYAHLPVAFGATDRAQGQLFATLARLALDSAQERAAVDLRAANLTDALRTRELIGQAQGILMERERITAEQAFVVLRRASQHMNIKLREVAETLVETGEAPQVDNGPA